MIASCRECHGKVSTEAASCPHCGAPSPVGGWTSLNEAPPEPSFAILNDETDRIPRPLVEKPPPPAPPQVVVVTSTLHPKRARLVRIVRRGGSFQTGFGVGCGLLAALIAVPLLGVAGLLFWIFGLPSFGSQKDGVKVKVSEPLTAKISDEWTKAQQQSAARLKRVEGLQLFGFEEKRIEGARFSTGSADWKLLHAREECPLFVETAREHNPRFLVVRRGRFVDAEDFYHDERRLCERCIP